MDACPTVFGSKQSSGMRKCLLVVLLAGMLFPTLVLPRSSAQAGDWYSPWPSYYLSDASGQWGYHRMHMTWSPFSGSFTTLYQLQRYVNIFDSGAYRCAFLSFSAYPIAGGLEVSQDGNGWNANYGNTPLWVTGNWWTSVQGGILQEAGVGTTANNYDCHWFQNNLALQKAWIGQNQNYEACYLEERWPFSYFGSGNCW